MLKRILLSLFTFGLLTAAAQAEEPAISRFKTLDGAYLRVAYWSAPAVQTPQGSILILPGRATFIEKYDETIAKLQERGFEVWAFDWRGQGGSSRLLSHAQKNHIDTFDTYVNDLHQLVSEHLQGKIHGPLWILGQSMGGHLALRYLKEHPGLVRVAVLVAPMLEIKTTPYPYFIASALVKTACWLGYGEAYALGYGDFDPAKSIFEGNKDTHDSQRYEHLKQLSMTHPDLVNGGPTFQWVAAAMASIDHMRNADDLKSVTVPVFLADAGEDQIVDASVDASLCNTMPHCTLKTYAHARHGILNEIPEIKEHFWRDFEAFVRSARANGL